MVSKEILHAPAYVLQELLQNHEIDARDLYEISLERSREIEELNAFRAMEEKIGRAAAECSAWRHQRETPLGMVDGIPIGVKDGFAMRGSVEREGSKTTGDDPSPDDGPAIGALRRNGFVPAGRTTMPEFGWKGVTDSPLCGATRNPWDPERTSGGSSGGNGVAVATGACAMALGTDIGGSVRIPASFCGIVGFKPTQDRAPRRPGSHAGVLSREGPMTRSVLDAAYMMDVTELRDETDQSGRFGPRYFEQATEQQLIGFEVALLLDHPDIDVHPEVEQAVRRAAMALHDLGCRVVEIDRDDLDLGGLRETYETLYSGDVTVSTRKLDENERQKLDPGLLKLTEWVEQLPLTVY
ncbi:MAG: amidase family protein, partial [Thermoanaerobaculia bacterium]|nr:amidase family protein [Thermoanaerobaculia bacterium]